MGNPTPQSPQSMVHNMSASVWRNLTDDGQVELVLAPGPVQTDNSEENMWLIHEYDNITLIDNAPYVGLRKVDSLIQYLLVCRCHGVT